MNTLPADINELNALLNEDAQARAEARTLANIARRAMTLFTDGGYTCNTYTENLAIVTSPKGDKYRVWHGEETGNECSCPCFAKRSTCKHLQAVLIEADEAAHDAAMEAQWERMTEMQNFFNGRFDR